MFPRETGPLPSINVLTVRYLGLRAGSSISQVAEAANKEARVTKNSNQSQVCHTSEPANILCKQSYVTAWRMLRPRHQHSAQD